MMARRALVFDLDGTLVHLNVKIEPARKKVEQFFAERGLGAPGQDCRPLLETVTRWAKRLGVEPEQALSSVTEAERVAARTARAVAGAQELLEALASRGLHQAILTNNHSSCAEPALRAAGLCPQVFSLIRGREQVPPKPSPRGLQEILRELAVAPQNAVFVGNHESDVLAGLRAGVKTLAISASPSKVEIFTRLGASQVVEELSSATLAIIEALLEQGG